MPAAAVNATIGLLLPLSSTLGTHETATCAARIAMGHVLARNGTVVRGIATAIAPDVHLRFTMHDTFATNTCASPRSRFVELPPAGPLSRAGAT